MAASRAAACSSIAGRARASVAALGERYQLAVNPDATVGKLSVGVRQRVEILKALYREARILILDEPTAVLTPQERDGLFAVMKHLVADGRTILFVTHKIHEVMAITDRVTVLRDGRVVERMVTRQTSEREIVRAMTGRSVNLRIEKPADTAGAAAARSARSDRRIGRRPPACRQGQPHRPLRRDRRHSRRCRQRPD